jgi:hypothetical protein
MYGLDEIKEMNERATEEAAELVGVDQRAEVAKETLEFIATCPFKSVLELPRKHLELTLAQIIGSAANAMAFISGEQTHDEWKKAETELTDECAVAAFYGEAQKEEDGEKAAA